MYFSKIAMFCLVAVASARPQLYNDYSYESTGSQSYSDITDESDPRFGFDSNPQYTYKYQVSDEKEQTYIAHDENRNGGSVTGQYSYVDPNGSLIIVKYTADDTNGYTETREVQENFLTVRSKPAPAPKPTQPPRRNDSDLVAKIISQLTPYIKQTVSDSLSARQQVVQYQPEVTGTSSLFGEDGENRITVDSKTYNFDKLLF